MWCLTRILWRRCFPKGKTKEEEGSNAKLTKPTEVHSIPSHTTETVKTKIELLQFLVVFGRLKVYYLLWLMLVMTFPGLTS